jgi:hypothetical protein
MHLTHDQLLDFIALTLNNIKRRTFTDISLDLQSYIVPRILKNHMQDEQGGAFIEFKVKYRNLGNAIHSGLYAEAKTGNRNIFTTGYMPWRKQVTSMSYDVDEDAFQTDRETIIKEIVGRVHAMECDMLELDEDDFFQMPTSPTDDVPHGLPYWFKKDTSTAGGFLGGNPTGHPAGCAGLSSTVYQNWKNYAFGYSSYGPGDLIKKIKKAIRATDWKMPLPHPELKWDESKKEILTTEEVVDALEFYAESRNDNHKTDVAKYMGQIVVAGIPVTEARWLTNNDPTNPLYGIDYSAFGPYARKGKFMRRSKPYPAPRQPSVRDVFMDCWKNYGSFNRRKLWIGAQAA